MHQSTWSGFIVTAAAMALLVGGRTAMAAVLGEPVTCRCTDEQRWQTVLDRCQSAVD